jgi:hypothetical protein
MRAPVGSFGLLSCLRVVESDIESMLRTSGGGGGTLSPVVWCRVKSVDDDCYIAPTARHPCSYCSCRMGSQTTAKAGRGGGWQPASRQATGDGSLTANVLMLYIETTWPRNHLSGTIVPIHRILVKDHPTSLPAQRRLGRAADRHLQPITAALYVQATHPPES